MGAEALQRAKGFTLEAQAAGLLRLFGRSDGTSSKACRSGSVAEGEQTCFGRAKSTSS